MSHRAFIGAVAEDGSIAGVYVHNAGYSSGVGETLLHHYRTLEQVEELIGLGSLSELGNAPDDVHTQAYHRDLNRPWEQCQPERYTDRLSMVSSPDVNQWFETIYLWQRGCWTYSRRISMNPPVYTEFGLLTQADVEYHTAPAI